MNKILNSRFTSIVHALFALAAILGLIAGLVIFFVPFGGSATATTNSNGNEVISVTPISFFEMQGWWGIWILLAFAALYYGPLHFYRRRSKGLAALFAVAAIILTVLAGFSIGPFYLIGALTLLVGLVLLPFSTK